MFIIALETTQIAKSLHLRKVTVSVLSYWSFQAAQRIKTPAKYIVGTATIPFNPSAFGEVNILQQLVSVGKVISTPALFLLFSRDVNFNEKGSLSSVILYKRVILR